MNKEKNICQKLYEEDDERIEIGANYEKILPIDDCELAIVDGNLAISGQGKDNFEYLKQTIESFMGEVNYGYTPLSEKWTIIMNDEVF